MGGEQEHLEPVGNTLDVEAPAGSVPLYRRVVVKLSLLLLLMAMSASVGVQRTFELNANSHAMVGEIAEVGRLRMLAQKISLEAVRPLATRTERFAAVNESVREFERLMERFSRRGNPLAEVAQQSERVRVALAALQPEWERLRDMAIDMAYSGATDASFEIASGNLLRQAELLIAALREADAERRDRLTLVLGVIIGLSLLLLLLFWHFIYRVVMTPVSELLGASQRLAQGDLGVRVALNRADEIGQLGRAFNVAAARIETMIRQSIEQEIRLTASETRHRLIAETSPDAIIMIDANGTIQYANSAVATVFGYAVADLVGNNIEMVQPEHLRSAHREGFARYLASGVHRIDWHRVETQALTRTGREIEVEIAFTHIEFDDGPRFAAYFRDVTERIEREAALQYNATHDDLTHLPNRVLLLDRLAQAIAVAERRSGTLAVLFIDLDNFKYINDSHGHLAGDQLLKEVATRILLVLREGDTLARLGGDEFVVLLDDLKDEMDVCQLGERLLEALQQSIRLDCGQVFSSASMGVALYPRDGDTPELLLKNADTALYRAKEQGRANLQFFTDEMQLRVQKRISIETALHHALEREEFELYFQPKAAVSDSQLAGCEALIRWHHPVHGIVPPNEFISVAEDTGLIVPIGAWVIDAACAVARRWRDAGPGALGQSALPIAINLSARQFRERNLLKIIDAALARYGLGPDALQLEVTESMTMHNPGEAIRIMQALKERGLTLAMDDFGTGYSSLAYLKRFPIDILKIDRSFIRDLPDDEDDRMIAGAIVSLAHSLGMEVVAEGVESMAQLSFLRQLGCNMIQGYVLARPMPALELERFVQSGGGLPPVDTRHVEQATIRIVKKHP